MQRIDRSPPGVSSRAVRNETSLQLALSRAEGRIRRAGQKRFPASGDGRPRAGADAHHVHVEVDAAVRQHVSQVSDVVRNRGNAREEPPAKLQRNRVAVGAGGGLLGRPHVQARPQSTVGSAHQERLLLAEDGQGDEVENGRGSDPRHRSPSRMRRVPIPAGAQSAERTARAIRGPRRADQRAKLHQGLIEIAGAPRGDESRGESFIPRATSGGLRIVAAKTGKNSADVSVHRRDGDIEGDRCDRAGRVCPDARQRAQRVHVFRDTAAVMIHDGACRDMKVVTAAVVTESRPEGENVVDRRGRQGSQGREAAHEPLEIRQNRPDLSLLEHELGNERGVRVGRVASPGEVAAMPVIPAQEAPANDRCGGFERDGVPHG